MLTAEDTACRTPGLGNVRSSGQTVRRRLRESRIWARRSVVEPILKQRHRTAILAWARARLRWRHHTWQHILFNDESRFSLRFSDGRYRVYRRRGERFTDQCVYDRFWRWECYALGWNLSWWLHSAQNCLRYIECRKIQTIFLILSFCPFYHSETLITSFNKTMQDVTWLVFVKTFWTRITPVFFLGRHLSPGLSPIEHLWNELSRRVRHRQNPPETPQELHDALEHLWNNIWQVFIQRLIVSMRRRCEAVVAARGGHTRYWTPRTSMHDHFCLSMICSDNDVETFCWYYLICYDHINLNYTICSLYVKHTKHQTLVSFVLLTGTFCFTLVFFCFF
jgi:hypothetical protein